MTSTAKTPHPAPTWLDIMPAIPLARGLPVIDTLTGQRWIVHRPRPGVHVDSPWVVVGLDDSFVTFSRSALRPDLDEAAAFAHALRRLVRHLRASNRRRGERVLNSMPGLRLRHWAGKTTDTDRLSLARALAAVSA